MAVLNWRQILQMFTVYKRSKEFWKVKDGVPMFLEPVFRDKIGPIYSHYVETPLSCLFFLLLLSILLTNPVIF